MEDPSRSAAPPTRVVRLATVADAAACRAVYAPYVEGTVVSFEEQVPTVEQVADRIRTALASYAWVVLEEDGEVVGYAYGGRHKERPAYRWSCEVSVYLRPGLRRSGAGRALYADLLERLAARGYVTAVAGMTLPNPASEGLHRAMGFEEVGTWRRIGWKDGAWRDVRWVQRPLSPADDAPPAEPR